MRLALGLALGLAACGATATQQAETPHLIVPPGRPVKGGVVRVEVAHSPLGIARYANVWRHVDNDQSERLEITADGRFEWKIERPGQNTCLIAGTVSVREDRVNALRWMMTTNTCNSSYEGKVSHDWIIQHDRHHLALVDAEFHGDPVPYDITSGQEGLQPDHVDPPTDDLQSFEVNSQPDPNPPPPPPP
ncbi:MAG: hypothetical protein K8W52_02030, partial [Deltaproteobacteria bacterium]|nr:hypothetical protein [Deltaproteobacteria bacterium]